MRYYGLDGQPISQAEGWALMENGAARTVARSVIGMPDGDVTVSTVFLVIDHAHRPGPPMLWETMIFGGPHDDECWRYATREAALAGHDQALMLARQPV